jgi:hypothetical protein
MLFLIRSIASVPPSNESYEFPARNRAAHASIVTARVILERLYHSYRARLNSQLVTAATGCRALLRGSVTSDTAIVEGPLSHHLIEISVLWISRIAVLPMMAHVALVQLRYSPGAYSVMATNAGRALFCLKGCFRIRTYKLFVSLVIIEDDSAPSLLVKPQNLRRKSAGCLSRLTGLCE